MRGWLAAGKSYVPPVQEGEVMRALGAGTVTASNHSDFAEGDTVVGMFGIQTHALSDGKDVRKIDTTVAPMERWIGGLGMPGLTAYFGLLHEAKPQAGETVLVSAASGAVGSVVGQIAKIKGCRVVGVAGGAEKCAYLTDEIGFDTACDYKAGGLHKTVEECVAGRLRRAIRECRRRGVRHRDHADEATRSCDTVRLDRGLQFYRRYSRLEERPAPFSSTG